MQVNEIRWIYNQFILITLNFNSKCIINFQIEIIIVEKPKIAQKYVGHNLKKITSFVNIYRIYDANNALINTIKNNW